MKAVILVGGFGTRLRPFTFTHPKPLVPFCNMPIVEHQIKALVSVGVNHVIFAVGHMEDAMVKGMKPLEEKYKIKLTFSIEEEPLGTAGPLGLCRELLSENQDEPFFMLNSDVACEFPLKDMLSFHKSHGEQGTILITPVEDPSKYGLVVSDKETGLIQQFLEKPPAGQSSYPSDKINAGIYILQPKILSLIPLPNPKPHNISIERQIFPELVIQKSLFSFVLPGYWMDVGQPKDFLKGTVLHLKSLRNHASSCTELATGPNIKGNVFIDPSAKVSPDATIGPDVVIGQNCVIEGGVRLVGSTIMEGSTVRAGALVKNSIVGWSGNIKSWAHLEGCFLGEDVTVAPEVILIDTVVCPHKSSGANSLTASIQL
jgi:mannose-1-phosphate guanylyltransferase